VRQESHSRAHTVLAVAAILTGLCWLPATARAGPVVAAAGDIACDPGWPTFNAGLGTADECRQQYTSDLVVAGSYDAVLALGDTQYESGAFDAFTASYDPTWGRVNAITHPVVGNHEYGTPEAAGYFDYFTGVGVQEGPAGPRGLGYYSFDLGKWHLVALNSNCKFVSCSRGSKQGAWLRDDLERSDAPCVLAYWHHPRFTSRGQSGERAVRPLWRALQAAGAELLLSGHDHNYERFRPLTVGGERDPEGVRQFVVGTGGKSLLPFTKVVPGSQVRIDDAYGILELRLRRAGYAWEFLREPDGKVLDSGQGRCH
jgi:hypothetical protein